MKRFLEEKVKLNIHKQSKPTEETKPKPRKRGEKNSIQTSQSKGSKKCAEQYRKCDLIPFLTGQYWTKSWCLAWW